MKDLEKLNLQQTKEFINEIRELENAEKIELLLDISSNLTVFDDLENIKEYDKCEPHILYFLKEMKDDFEIAYNTIDLSPIKSINERKYYIMMIDILLTENMEIFCLEKLGCDLIILKEVQDKLKEGYFEDYKNNNNNSWKLENIISKLILLREEFINEIN